MSYIIKHYKESGITLSSIHVTLPEIQRMESNQHTEEIYMFEKNYYDIHGEYCLHGNITVAINNKTQTNYLIDGQHRINAYYRLQNDFPERPLNINIDYYVFDGNHNLDTIYKMINTNKINPITELSIDNYKIINETIKYLCHNFKEYVKHTENPHKPSFNPETIKNKLMEKDIINQLGITTAEQLINRMIEINKFYSTINENTYKKWGIKNACVILNKISHMSNKFYLGMYRTEWIDVLINCPTQEWNKIPHYMEGHRIPISKNLREKVWGSKMMEGSCYCCQLPIKFNNFECGHIIPVSKGGQTILDNLKPICRSGKMDMSNTHMEEYKKQLMTENNPQ
jgi:hypothetical protein